jgi:lysophospholipase L1-like esterase
VNGLLRFSSLGLLTGLLALAVACGSKSPTSPTPPVDTPTTPTTPTTPPPADPPPPPPPPAPTLKFTKFVAFGDSLTEGVISPFPSLLFKLDAPSAYPAILQGLLAGRYTSQTPTVLNRGVAGEEAADGLSRFIDVLRQDQPQVTIILEGFNDVSALGNNKGIMQGVGAVESMVKMARSRGVQVMLATLPPERAGGTRTLPTSLYNEFNRQIRGTAQDEGAALIDLSAEININSIGADGVHFTEMGYQDMANVYFRHIQMLYEQPAQSIAPASKPIPTGTH